jgi:hypothetical protein
MLAFYMALNQETYAMNTVRLQRWEQACNGEMKEYSENSMLIYPGSSRTATGRAHRSIQHLITQDIE